MTNTPRDAFSLIHNSKRSSVKAQTGDVVTVDPLFSAHMQPHTEPLSPLPRPLLERLFALFMHGSLDPPPPPLLLLLLRDCYVSNSVLSRKFGHEPGSVKNIEVLVARDRPEIARDLRSLSDPLDDEALRACLERAFPKSFATVQRLVLPLPAPAPAPVDWAFESLTVASGTRQLSQASSYSSSVSPTPVPMQVPSSSPRHPPTSVSSSDMSADEEKQVEEQEQEAIPAVPAEGLFLSQDLLHLDSSPVASESARGRRHRFLSPTNQQPETAPPSRNLHKKRPLASLGTETYATPQRAAKQPRPVRTCSRCKEEFSPSPQHRGTQCTRCKSELSRDRKRRRSQGLRARQDKKERERAKTRRLEGATCSSRIVCLQ